MKVKDRVVAVTGGAHGIGHALCERFAREGAGALSVLDLEADAAAACAESITAAGFDGEILSFGCDVGDREQLVGALEETAERLGDIEILCSNAGFAHGDGPGWTAVSQTDAQWDSVWRVHVMSHVWGARAVLPAMIRRGEGYLVQTASAAGLITSIGDASYAVTKHACIAFAESLAITHGEQGIRVSVLCPQGVRTRLIEMDDFVAKSVGGDGIVEPEDVAENVVQAMDEERFLILPHPETLEYLRRKAGDYDRWLQGMRKYRRMFFPSDEIMEL